MYRKTILMAICAMLICTALYGYRVHTEQRQVADRLVRLHIVANSDTAQDQDLKLQVRDALLPEISALTARCGSRKEAEAVLQQHLPELTALAQRVLRQTGSEQTVTARLSTELFPRREYETFSLPAGSYRTLRITLGEGEGHNWWCVAFPALCTLSASQQEEALEAANFTRAQRDLLTGEDMTVELKFKSLELWKQLRQWLQAH